MTQQEDRHLILSAVNETLGAGACLRKICEELGISMRTVQRWQKDPAGDKRKGSARNVRNKMSESEKREILEVVNLPEYRNLAPAEIVAILAENGLYLASERTIYRILTEFHQLGFRGPGKKSVPREKPYHEATGPLQVLSWDITYLKTNIRGIFFYLYLVMDVWSRKIITWEIHTEELSELSANMMGNLSQEIDLRGVILHSDNGGPMKGTTMLLKLHDLGVTKSFSRPRVSEDNPYSEALFKTLKYRAGYPKIFATLQEARNWVANFVHWYNHKHRHSGINYVTPDERHTGRDKEILLRRTETYRKARAERPERFSTKPKEWKYIEKIFLGRPKVA